MIALAALSELCGDSSGQSLGESSLIDVGEIRVCLLENPDSWDNFDPGNFTTIFPSSLLLVF